MHFFRIPLLFAIILIIGIYAHFEFNNVKCVERDPTFVIFEYCFLRSVNRTYKYISLKTHFHQLPIGNAFVTFKLVKRGSVNILGRFNGSVDACKFLTERHNPLANFVFATFEDYSNINHSCPYNHDIYVEKLPVSHVYGVIKNVIPDGHYYLNLSWSSNNIPRAEINIYFTKS